MAAEFKIGDRVISGRGKGVVKYFGETKFAEGIWVGIELDEANGKNDGNVGDVHYFTCKPNHGVFAQPGTVRMDSQPRNSVLPKPSGMKAPSTSGRKSVLPKPSPLTTPKMSPAVSMERLTKIGPNKKANEQIKMQPVEEIETPVSKSVPAKPQQPPVSASSQSIQPQRSVDLNETDRGFANVKEQAKKIDQQPGAKYTFQRQDSQMTDVSITPADDTIVRGLKDEIADLNSKLEALREKRKEDKSKLAELDRLRIQHQGLLEYKISITEEHRMLRRKLEETEMQLEEMLKRAENAEASMSNDLGEQLELVTLDKLMAEERVEMLQAEVEEQKMRMETMESEMQMLKAEMQSLTSTDGSGELVGNTVQFKQLTEQMEQYKQAIIKMRDLVQNANADRIEMEKQLEHCRGECERYQTENDRLVVDFNRARAEIAELHEQMDAAMGSTRMVDYLTEQNLNLEDQMRTLTEEKEHLEELLQLSEEIAEAARQTQMDIRQECDMYVVSASEKTKEIQFLENRIRDYDNVVQKFRQKISDLNDEIVGYKDQIQILDHQLADRDADGTLNATALFTSNRNFADRVQSKLNSLKVKYLEEQLKYLREFLPNNFSKAGGDNDCILLTVFFSQMAEKSELLSKLLDERYPDVPDGMQRDHVVKSHKAEQWAHVRKFRYFLCNLSSVMHRFESVIKNCTLESLSRLAASRSETANQEHKLDWYLNELLEKRLDESTPSESLERIVAFFQRQLFLNVTAGEYDTRSAMSDYLQQFLDGVEWIRFNCARLKFFLFPNEAEDSEFSEFLYQMDRTCEEIAGKVVRANKLIPTDKMIDFSATIKSAEDGAVTMLDLVTNGFSYLEKVARRLHDSSNFAASQLMTNDVDGFSANEILGFLQSVVEKMSGSTHIYGAMIETQNALSDVSTVIDDISSALEKHRLEIPLLPIRNSSPLHDRAAARKEDVVDAEALRWQISKKDEEITRLARALKGQEDSVCMLKIKLERLKKETTEAGQQESAVSSEKIKEMFDEERRKYEKTISELRGQVDEIEKQKKTKENEMERVHKTAVAFRDSQAQQAAGRTTKMGGLNLAGAQEDPIELAQSLYWAQDRIRRLQAELDARNLLALKPLKLPEKVCGIETLKVNKLKSLGEAKRKTLLDEANLLQLEHQKLKLMESHGRKDAAFQRLSVEYNNRVADLRARTQTLRDQYFPHVPLPDSLVKSTDQLPSSSNEMKVEFKTIMDQIKQRRIARQVANAAA
ncbi:Dynactin subunit 1 [Aphelenchoides besseyi]|nr:Dynactin subunit 1 [Aphelenchoides besseyi]KAI6194774.1 Dynactin subunit 1 [Aphelenchoides besseyi]